jgi:iron complex transport system permease protein
MKSESDTLKREEILSQYKEYTGRKILFILSSLAVITIVTGIAARLGSYETSFLEAYSIIWNGLFTPPVTTDELVIWNLRLPRIFLAIVSGIALACAGTMLQGILRNPIAAPYNLGISSFAGFGAIVGITLFEGLFLYKYTTMACAFVFAMIPATVLLAISRTVRVTSETIILSGVAMMFVATALTSILMYFAESDAAKAAYLWTVGDLSKAAWPSVYILSGVLIVLFPILFIKSWDVNAMNAGDEVAQNLGVHVGRTRLLVMMLSSVLVATVVCFTGTIGFIDLVAPHIARLIIGGDNRYLLPAAGLFGGALLVTCDTIARTIMAPIMLPVGIVTACIGSPVFLYLIIRRKKSYW